MRAKILASFPKTLGERSILLATCLGALLAWQLTCRNFENLNEVKFSVKTEILLEKIQKRMEEYEQVLLGGIALHRSSNDVTRDEWCRYVTASKVHENFPGIQAMAVARVIPNDEIESHERSIQDEGFQNYQVYPESREAMRTSIVFIEPFDWRNQRAFGYDMYSEPVRRFAMQKAVDTGSTCISGKITLVQETDKDVQPGILCYLPIFDNQSHPVTAEERRQALRGWVYAAFRFHDLMNGIVGEDGSEITIKIFDTRDASQKNLLFDSHSGTSVQTLSSLERTIHPPIAGRVWTIQFDAESGFVDPNQATVKALVALGGLLFNALVFLLLHSLRLQRESALRKADELSQGYHASEARNHLILENASEAILFVSATGEILSANSAAHSIFASSKTLLGQNLNHMIKDFSIRDVSNRESSVPNNELEVTCLRQDGSPFHGRISVGHVKDHGQDSFIVIIRDETAQVEAIKRQAELNQELVAASHRAGRAEVATGVLHNVGNVVNSVNVSASLLKTQVENSPVTMLEKAAEVISENEGDLPAFFDQDSRAAHFPELLRNLAAGLKKSQEKQFDELAGLLKNVQHIKEVINLQQGFAKAETISELVQPDELFRDALKINELNIRTSEARISCDFQDLPPVSMRKHEVLQILVNLIKNAQQSVNNADTEPKLISLNLSCSDSWLTFSVQDNGVGITEEIKEKIFQHGFTTKDEGHGFGLHACMRSAKSMGGTLTFESEGEGRGAVFRLTIPLSIVEDKADVQSGSPVLPGNPVAGLSSSLHQTP